MVGMMTDKHQFPRLLSGFSPWIILGAVLVMLPIVALMTLETINRQKKQSIHLMMEKGAALIRSFEAGTRMGMQGYGSGFQLQRLLVETAAQPDIAHLLVVGFDGTVIAHSRVDQVGGRSAPAWISNPFCVHCADLAADHFDGRSSRFSRSMGNLPQWPSDPIVPCAAI